MATSPRLEGRDTDPIMLMAGGVLIWGFIYLLWSHFHTQLATFYSWVRIVEFAPFTIFQSIWMAALGGALLVGGGAVFFAKKAYAKHGLVAVIAGLFLVACWGVGSIFASWFTFLRLSDKSLLQWSHLTTSSLYANLFALVVFVIPAALWIARRSLATNPTNHKHFARPKDFTLHTFTDRMGETYPHLKLFRKLNLTARSINKGWYRMADTEKQFAIKHQLLDRVKGNEFKVNSERSTEIFLGQMGPLWTRYDALSRWELAVMAVLLPRLAATDPDMSEEAYKGALARTEELILGYWKDAARTYDAKRNTLRLDLRLAKDTVRKYGASAKVRKFFKAHAYVGTIIYAMLLEARSLGVLPPSEFRWLRVVDRRLWLLVDNVGKSVAVTEVGGIYYHFLHELSKKRAIEKPAVEGAVRALVEGVEKYAFFPDEIDAVNKQLADKEEAVRIEREATAKQRKNLFLLLLVAGSGKQKALFEVAVTSEVGETVYHQRCRPDDALDTAVRERFRLSDADVAALKDLPPAAQVAQRLLEVCNGHHVITFGRGDLALVPGIERSAAEIEDCKGEGEFDLLSTGLMEGVVPETDVQPICDALTAARICRGLWVEKRKQELEEEAKGKGA